MRDRVRGVGGEFRIYDAKPGMAVEVALPIAQITPVSNAAQK
jgi:signal transduction histidine kinase